MNRQDQSYHQKELDVTEGSVEFSHLQITRGGWPNLTLKLKENEEEFWVRGEHRIDVGEKVRLHYERHSSPHVAEAYEILRGKKVVFRYSSRCCEFREQGALRGQKSNGRNI